MIILRCKQFSDLLTQNVKNLGMGYLFVMCDLSMHIAYEYHFGKQYRHVTIYLHMYNTRYYIFLCTVTLLLLTIFLTLRNGNISSNTTFTSIVISETNHFWSCRTKVLCSYCLLDIAQLKCMRIHFVVFFSKWTSFTSEVFSWSRFYCRRLPSTMVQNVRNTIYNWLNGLVFSQNRINF